MTQSSVFDIGATSAAIATIIAAELVKRLGLGADKYGPIYTLVITLVTSLFGFMPSIAAFQVPYWAQVALGGLVAVGGAIWSIREYFGLIRGWVLGFWKGRKEGEGMGGEKQVLAVYGFNYAPTHAIWTEIINYVYEKVALGEARFLVNGQAYVYMNDNNYRTSKTAVISNISFKIDDAEYAIKGIGVSVVNCGKPSCSATGVFRRETVVDMVQLFPPGTFPSFFTAFNLASSLVGYNNSKHVVNYLGVDEKWYNYGPWDLEKQAYADLMKIQDPFFYAVCLLCTSNVLDMRITCYQLSIIANKIGFRTSVLNDEFYLAAFGPIEKPLITVKIPGKPRDNLSKAINYGVNSEYYTEFSGGNEMRIIRNDYETIKLQIFEGFQKKIISTGASPIYAIRCISMDKYSAATLEIAGGFDLQRAEEKFFNFCELIQSRFLTKHPVVTVDKEVERFDLHIKSSSGALFMPKTKESGTDKKRKDQEGEKVKEGGVDEVAQEGGGGGVKGGGGVERSFEIVKRSCGNTHKNFSNLFLSEGVEKKLVKTIAGFKDKTFHKQLGIPHKLGFIFYGEPGCGKSSCIEAICSELGKPMFSIKLSSIKTNEQFRGVCEYVIDHEGVLVFEDIDVDSEVVLKREYQSKAGGLDSLGFPMLGKSYDSDYGSSKYYYSSGFYSSGGGGGGGDDKLSLSTILNVLQGSETRDNFVYIITTNCYEKLDEALIRNGRIDVTVKLERCTRYQIGEIYKRIMKVDIDPAILEKVQEKKYFPYDILIGFYQSKMEHDAIDVCKVLGEIDEEYLKKYLGRHAEADADLKGDEKDLVVKAGVLRDPMRYPESGSEKEASDEGEEEYEYYQDVTRM
jgi:DNA polymerase III delta prime subunit